MGILPKYRQNKRTNLYQSNGVVDPLTISSLSSQLPSDDEAIGDLGEDVEPLWNNPTLRQLA